MNLDNSMLQVSVLQARHEIQASWSEVERRQRRRLAEERQRALMTMLFSPREKADRRQLSVVGAA
jgi:hypothetical protein